MEATTYFNSPIGCLEIIGSSKGIRSLKRIDSFKDPKEDAPKYLLDCIQQLKEYFDGDRKTFRLKFDWSGKTDFNQSVWKELLEIPYGHTTSYSAIAEKIGNPKAVRAVGLANRNNPIAIAVPCHRVIAKNGHLQGYFYGLETKRFLLQLENPMSFAEQGSLF